MKKFTYLFIALLSTSTTFAQQLPMYNQAYIAPNLVNPAMVGYNSSIDIFLLHRNQWTNLPGAPVTSTIAADGPVKADKNGVGLNLFTDATGIITNTGASASYRHRFNLNRNSRILVGGTVGMVDTKLDFTKAVVVDPNESYLFQTAQRKSMMTGGLGVAFVWKGLELGFSVPQLMNSIVIFEDNNNAARMTYSRHYISTAKFQFTVSEKLGLSAYPYIVVRNTENAPVQYDLSAVVDYQNKFWAAVTYKSTYAVSVNAGIRLYNALTIGYSYDVITNSSATNIGRASEIIVGLAINKLQKNKAVAMVDSDNDGVADEFDLEANTPAGNMVNFQGKTIPLAVTVAGSAKDLRNGTNSFDKDNDFIPDSVDVEPNTPKGLLVDRFGRRLGPTEDLDNDGVSDDLDKELGTMLGALVGENGVRIIRDNEDLDDDGINDKQDKQLNTPPMSIVNADGVRIGSKYDVDDDGVADSVDMELNSARGAVVNNYGQSFNINMGDSIKVLYETSFFFDYDKAFVKPGHDEQFASAALYLKSNPNARIVLSGHCDSRGSLAYNMNLGQRRAQAIAKILTKDYGVSPEQISTVISKGSTDPMSQTKHNINRRVDLTVERTDF